jgi:type II secretory pathway pseudopilin PulG
MRMARSTQRPRNQAGFTLIELMIAGVLLVFGVMTMAGLVGLTVKNNGHSRLDSTATMLNQAVVEQVTAGINYQSFGGTGTAFFTDCGSHGATNPWPVETEIGGARLQTAGSSAGYINFTQAKTAIPGYQMDYVVCNGGVQVTYDVRWNISAISPASTTSFTHILTVGAQMEGGATGSAGIINFPINMRVMVGPDPQPGS